MSKKNIYFSSLFYSYMVFGSVAISFRCAFLRGIECFLLRKYISNFAKATREKRFTTMTPLGMSRDVTCHRLWRHNCFSNSIQFDLIYFISIWTSHNLLKFHTFLCIRKRNELFDHPSYDQNWYLTKTDRIRVHLPWGMIKCMHRTAPHHTALGKVQHHMNGNYRTLPSMFPFYAEVYCLNKSTSLVIDENWIL